MPKNKKAADSEVDQTPIEDNDEVQTEQNEEAVEQPVENQDPQTDQSDQEVQDKESEEPKEEGKKSGISAKLKAILCSKKAKIVAPIVVVALVALYLFVQPVRFAVLNIFSSANVTVEVLDSDTNSPVDMANVSFPGGKSALTGKDGKAKVSGINYGQQDFSVSKDNFKSASKSVLVKNKNQVIDTVKITSIGVPVTVNGTNTLSGQVLSGYKVAIDGTEVSAISDDKGVAIIKVPDDKLGKVKLRFSADGFNDKTEEAEVKRTANKPLDITITPSGKHYFLSNRSGKIGVYSSNLDGTDQKEVIAGSERNDSSTEFSVSPNGKYAAYISKKDGLKDSKGESAPALFSINLQTNAIKRIDEGANSMGTIGWASNSVLIYTINYNDYERKDNTKIKSADMATSKLVTLNKNTYEQGAYHFQDDPNHVYFTKYDNGKNTLHSITVSTNTDKALMDGDFYDYKKTKIGKVSYKKDSKWYELNSSTQKLTSVSESGGDNKYFIPSIDGKKVTWSETRDRKGVAVIANIDGSGEKVIESSKQIEKIYRWLNNDYLIVSIKDGDDTSDYVLHIASGKATKIASVYALTYRFYEGY